MDHLNIHEWDSERTQIRCKTKYAVFGYSRYFEDLGDGKKIFNQIVLFWYNFLQTHIRVWGITQFSWMCMQFLSPQIR